MTDDATVGKVVGAVEIDRPTLTSMAFVAMAGSLTEWPPKTPGTKRQSDVLRTEPFGDRLSGRCLRRRQISFVIDLARWHHKPSV